MEMAFRRLLKHLDLPWPVAMALLLAALGAVVMTVMVLTAGHRSPASAPVPAPAPQPGACVMFCPGQ